ncbi:apolipoprotein N-acyltransferase [Peteryoungia desertarenae]|uniref:Apolipoprotein N-acyltransferase n=1 Tax=Peteryoungia desertarenae TaxID=1813451 RepID=A0ABX6QLR8_9HYPH|nr:apolipoprotein N-acyltransferase [Peteryoungia desertarenae]QLF69212.1 apolipoprotein N-acyltransferase [Peteryoungia desertarenae]
MEKLASKVMLLWGWRRAGLAILAGAIGALAMPPVSFFAALFLSFTLLVWLIDGTAGSSTSGRSLGLRSSFLLGWFFGLGYFVAGLWWLGSALLIEADEFAWALPLAVLGLPSVLALFYGCATMVARLLWSDGLGRVAALASSVGFFEWLRSFVATGFPWNAIGYGAMPVPVMMQSAHLIGIAGVTTLAVFVFAAPALLATRKGASLGMMIAVLLFSAHLGYGYYRLEFMSYGPLSDADRLIVRLVQPAIDQARKLENADRVEIFETHLSLSAAPPAQGEPQPNIIIWPETSLPFILTENPDALVRIGDTLKDGQLLVVGAVRAEEQGAGTPPRYYNSVYMIDDRGQILSASDKVHLTPFGEYVPFEDVLRRMGIETLISLPGGFSAASSRSVLTTPAGLRLYPLICYEIIFPDEILASIETVDAIVNVTNDAWFGNTPGPYQHFQQARIRAVEVGVPVIRVANSGISALIDPFGRITSGLSLGQKGAMDATINKSFVSLHADTDRHINYWLILLVVFLVAIVSRMGFIRRLN